MTKREAMAVAKAIRKIETIEITGFRVERMRGGANYEIDCRDQINGYPFVIRSRDDWDARRAEAMMTDLGV